MTGSGPSRFPLLADESHWNAFVVEFGGELIAPLIRQSGVKNADYLFRKQKVIAELKILQTEFFDPLLVKIGKAAATLNENPTDEALDLFERVMFSTLEAPLKRIVNKANRQIKETKAALALHDHRGVTLCINDGFTGFPPHIVSDMLFRVLRCSSYSNTQCIVYMTNHLVKLDGSDEPALLWWPHFIGAPNAEVVGFIDELGQGWSRFLTARAGSAARPKWTSVDTLRNSTVVRSIRAPPKRSGAT